MGTAVPELEKSFVVGTSLTLFVGKISSSILSETLNFPN